MDWLETPTNFPMIPIMLLNGRKALLDRTRIIQVTEDGSDLQLWLGEEEWIEITGETIEQFTRRWV